MSDQELERYREEQRERAMHDEWRAEEEARAEAEEQPVSDESLVMTLAEAERELVVNVLRNYHRDHRDDPEVGAWPTVARDLAERFAASSGPVVERDDKAELVKALREIVKGAPVAEPERYEGDNHGDTAAWGFAAQHYADAQIARAALAAVGEGE